MTFTPHGVYTWRGKTVTVFNRVPIRGIFSLSGSPNTARVKLTSATLGLPADVTDSVNPYHTSNTGKVTFHKAPVLNMRTAQPPVIPTSILPKPPKVVVDHPFDDYSQA